VGLENLRQGLAFQWSRLRGVPSRHSLKIEVVRCTVLRTHSTERVPKVPYPVKGTIYGVRCYILGLELSTQTSLFLGDENQWSSEYTSAAPVPNST
jgi:hypothetical protein